MNVAAKVQPGMAFVSPSLHLRCNSHPTGRSVMSNGALRGALTPVPASAQRFSTLLPMVQPHQGGANGMFLQSAQCVPSLRASRMDGNCAGPQSCPIDLGDLSDQIAQKGFCIADCADYAPAPTTLAQWVAALRKACEIGLPPDQFASTLRPAVKLVWQHRPEDGEQDNKGTSHWCLRAPNECVRQSVEALPEAQDLLQHAEHYFQALDACLRPQFDVSKYGVIKEIRYTDQVDSVLRESTRWHHDGAPIYLTTLNTWLGETTIFRPPPAQQAFAQQSLGAPVSNQGFLNRVRHALSGEQKSPLNHVLAFHGKSGVNPLWHRSPKTFAPRLLLIYRLVEKSKSPENLAESA